MPTSRLSPSLSRLPLASVAPAFLLGLAAACEEPPTQQSPLAPKAQVDVQQEAAGPTVVDPNLQVRTVIAGLSLPIGMAFLGANDMLVLEKNTGKVQRVVNGGVQSTALDLAVNFAQERGLVGIALHPRFPATPYVYLYWTESSTGADVADPPLSNRLLTPLLGNRVDRFVWNGSSLSFDRTLVRLRALQNEGAPEPIRANHVGGVIRFGHDGKLYVLMGDAQRRGQLQNLPSGPTPDGQGQPIPDDQFGGPQPDDAHLSGGILRLNEDGTTPADNPFFGAGAQIGGEAGANIQKLFAYGLRNSFGMAVDPVSGILWAQENGDDAFDELNRVEAGMNGGWIQIMGPVDRIAEFKAIELSQPGGRVQGQGGLFRLAWPASNIAETPQEALSRLFVLPGSHYSDPEFSWKYVVPPAGIGFLSDSSLGPQYKGDLFVGSARGDVAGGFLFHFNLTGNRQKIGVEDPRLEDRVADNLTNLDLTESESLLFGRDFGVVTDIQTGPNGNLFVVSLTTGAIYEIYRSKAAEETP